MLTTIGVIPSLPVLTGTGCCSCPWRGRWSTLNSKGGLPASVIPEFVGDQPMFPQSIFYEVKAVTGNLTPGTSNWQILGLLDVANTQITKPAGPHPPPAVFFITTGNTTVSSGVVNYGNMWNVAVWRQDVLYDANSATPNNPNLTLGMATCLNKQLYAQPAWANLGQGAWPVIPLTSPTTPPSTLLVPGDPDPAEVD